MASLGTSGGKRRNRPRLTRVQAAAGTTAPWRNHFLKRAFHSGSSLRSRVQCSRTAQATAMRIAKGSIMGELSERIALAGENSDKQRDQLLWPAGRLNWADE